MIRGNSKYLLCAAALAALSACDGCYQAQDERQLVLTFNKPAVGAQLTDADDTDRTRNGLQYDVEVKLEWESLTDGTRTPADIAEAGLSVAKKGEDFPDAVQGTVGPGGVATFSGVTFLTNGDYNLRATARELGSNQTTDPNTILISVQSVPNRPQVLTSRIVQDGNDDLKLSLAELPVGESMKVEITTVNLSSGRADVISNGQVVGTVPVANDQAILTLDGLPHTTAFEGQYTLQLRLENTAGLQSAPSVNPPDTLTVTVDQVGPTVLISEPTDKDGGYGSRTITATATVTGAPNATVQFEAKLLSDGGTIDAGTAVVDATGTASTTVSVFEGRQDLTAFVSDGVGNPGSDSVSFFVNTAACFVTITDPPTGSYLGPSQDATPSDGGFDYVIRGTSTDCPNQTARVTVGTTEYVGTTDSSGDFAILAGLQQGQNAVRVDVDNGAGVLGSAATDVFLGTTDFRIIAPVNNAVLNRASDVNSGLTGIQTSLNWAGAPQTGATVTICSNLPASGTSTPCPDGSTWIVFAANTPQSAIADYPDGTYQLKALLLSGGNVTATSATVAIKVDSVRPLVAPNGIRLQNDANNDLRLNATEQPSGAATAIITTSGMEDGATVTVKNASTSAVLGTGTTTGNSATIALASVTGPEADYPLVVELTDAAGNTNNTGAGSAADPRNDDAFRTARVDRVAPSCGITQPTKTNVGPADDASATVSGFQLHTECVSQADIASVSFQANTVPPVAAALTGTTAAADITLNATGTTVYTLTATPTDAAGNVGTASTKQVTADFDAPSVTINTPNQAGGPYGQYTLATSVSVPGESTGTVRVYSTVGTGPEQLVGALTITSGSASGNLTYPNGVQTLRAEVTDAAGNVGNDTETITVASAGCSISLSAPAPGKQYFGQSDDLDRTTTPLDLEYVVTGASSNCANRPVSVYRGTGTGRVLLNSGTTSGAGAFSLQISLAEGAQHLEVEVIDSGNVASFVAHDATVDLRAPAISLVTPSLTTVTYVAESNINIRNNVAGYIKDTDNVTPLAQVSLSFRVTEGVGAKAYVFFAGAQIGNALDVDADPDDLTAAVTLPQGAGALEIRVVDQAGNTVTHAKTATVDAIPPAAPAFTATTTNLRAATINLAWPAVNDDGTTASTGAPAGYDLRWTNTVHVANGVLTDDDFFNLPNQTPPRLKRETGALLPGSAVSYTLTVPPLQTSFIALRAVDDVGNYSVFVPSTSVTNTWPQVTLNNPGPSTFYGWSMASRGDINGDGFNDFIVSAISTAPGRAHVYFGKSDLATLTDQSFGPSDGDTTSQSFGWVVDMGNVSHATGPSLSDVAVAAPGWGTNIGRVYLYFGQTGASFDASATNAVIFQGTAGLPIGRGVSIIGDINNDQMGELLITSTSENSNRGRVYVFFGRSKTSWELLKSGGVIPMTAADRIIEGPQPVGAGAANNSFAWWRAIAPLNSVDGDARNDFVVSTASDSANKLFVMSGATVATKTATTGTPTLLTGDAPGTADESMERLTMTDIGTGTTQSGYGSRVVGGVNLLDTSATDLLVSQPHRTKIHIHRGVTGGPFSATSTVITGPASFGYAIAAGDLNGDGRNDVVASDVVTGANSAWVFINSGISGQEFDSAAGVGFGQSKLSPSSAIGRAAALADINGDNKVDLLLTDTTAGKVTLWY